MISVEMRYEKHIESARWAPSHYRPHGLYHACYRIRAAVVNIHEVGEGYRVGNQGRLPCRHVRSKILKRADVEAALTHRKLISVMS
ncbi:hypothetical protein X745_11890 [Mesorhizobium sp. LNJC374B00]|nr:hypothetical protein X745_11890 [Mesorhizobium sp. LNJC374B00]